MNQENAIEVRQLVKSFKKVRVLEGINLQIRQGTILALLGPNGAGKTTTIKILATLLKPDSGQAIVAGYDVVKNPDKVRSVIGLTGQYSAVDEYLTGRENLQMMGRLYHLSPSDSNKKAEELLGHFDLLEVAGRPAKTYSGGLRRRLDLAASLIASPPILFLDEPTTGLDPRSRIVVWETIRQLVEAGTTILLTTQQLDEADHLANWIAVLDKGKIIAEGTSAKLKSEVGEERLELLVAKGHFDRATTILKGKHVTQDDKTRTISIAIDDSVEDIQEILFKIEKSKIEIDSISLRKPTLDDVFLKLTGHEAEEKENSLS